MTAHLVADYDQPCHRCGHLILADTPYVEFVVGEGLRGTVRVHLRCPDESEDAPCPDAGGGRVTREAALCARCGSGRNVQTVAYVDAASGPPRSVYACGEHRAAVAKAAR